jgi:hypothetical protein
MEAVILDKGLLYLGINSNRSREIAQQNAGSTLHSNITLECLSDLLGFSDAKLESNQGFESEAAKKLLEKLKSLGFDNSTDIQSSHGEKTCVEVKSLGLRGMKTVYDSVIAMNELMRQTAASQEEIAENEDVKFDC